MPYGLLPYQTPGTVPDRVINARKPAVGGYTGGTAPQSGYTPPTGSFPLPHGGYPYPYNQMTGGVGYNTGAGGYRQVAQMGQPMAMPSQAFDPRQWMKPFKMRTPYQG